MEYNCCVRNTRQLNLVFETKVLHRIISAMEIQRNRGRADNEYWRCYSRSRQVFLFIAFHIVCSIK